MVALKPSEVDAFIARPDPRRPIVLVYGPDLGLVTERVEAIVRGSVEDLHDPFALARLAGDDLASAPERLVEEAHTVPLFGGRRAIWARAGSRNIVPAVEALIAAPPQADCRVVIEAGDLRRGAPLRNVCERAKSVAVIACYADGERDLARLVETEVRVAGLAIAPDARDLLVSLLGGDRLASRGEIAKLTLYAHGKRQIEIDDVIAVVSDASGLALDGVADAAFAGALESVETQYARALADKRPPDVLAAMVLRHAMTLHRARLDIERGASVESVVENIRPPLHFRRKPAAERALRAWSADALEAAIGDLSEAALESRRSALLASDIAGRAFLRIAERARRRRRA